VALGHRLGRGAVLQVGCLDGKEHRPRRGFQAGAGRAVLEGIEAELVQQHRQGDLRVVRHRIPQRQGAVGRQLADQPLRQRLDDVVSVVVIIRLAAADGDDGALHIRGGRCRPVSVANRSSKAMSEARTALSVSWRRITEGGDLLPSGNRRAASGGRWPL